MKFGKESIEQIKVFEWVKNNTNLPFMHIANERSCTPQQGSILKRMGVRAGVSDIFIPRASKGHHGCFIELKVGANKPTDLQKLFLEEMTNEGYFAACVWGSDAAIEVIKCLYPESLRKDATQL